MKTIRNVKARMDDKEVSIEVVDVNECFPRCCPVCNFPLSRSRDFIDSDLFQLICRLCEKHGREHVFISDGNQILYRNWDDAKNNKPWILY